MPTLGVIADPLDEAWASMDLCAEMLALHASTPWTTRLVRPDGLRFARRLPSLSRGRRATMVDRLLTRFLRAPRFARALPHDADAYHIVDHTYAHLAHTLPPERTGVYCHDLDAFRSILEPHRDRKPFWFRRLARWQLTGLQHGAIVFHNSLATRDEILRHRVVGSEKLVHAPLGVAPEFTPDAPSDAPPTPWSAALEGRRYLLHVGSCIPRKRIDVLLEVFAQAAKLDGDLRLLKIGGTLTPTQQDQLESLRLGSRVIHQPYADRTDLAQAYRSALAVLVPSESEGYGLPVVEALACGAPVIASDLPVLREVGQDGCLFASVADVPTWVDFVRLLINEDPGVPDRATRLAAGNRHTWRRHAEIVVDAYERLLS